MNPNVIEANLFKEEQETKEEKVKQVLQLEHTLTVEDEHYEFPPIELLSEGEKKTVRGGKKAVADTAAKLQKTLYSFGVSAKVENVSVGPAITRYELKPAEGVRVSKIANLADDIALNLAAETIRIEAPIPGKQAVGIEVPNKENEIVPLRDIIDCDAFKNHKSKLAFALGKDVAGNEVVTDIAKMPHVLIAGATGSGKSVCINTLIASIIYKAKPSEVKLVMVDPKVVELSVYNGIPHLLIPVVTDPKKAAGALAWAVQEMVNRYSLFASKNVRDIKGYNALTFVPLGKKRFLERGYNQSELIAHTISDILHVRLINNIIYRKKETKALSSLNSKEDRLNMIKNAFVVNEDFNSKNKINLLIIDDVFTTGSTLNELSKEIKKLECINKVGVLTVARA